MNTTDRPERGHGSRRQLLTYGLPALGLTGAGFGLGVLIPEGDSPETESPQSTRSSPAIVDVRDFGAVGDGKTDNIDSWQDAIDSVSPGGTVVFPAHQDGSSYFFSDTLKITKPVRIIGGGSPGLVVDDKGSNLSTELVFQSGKSGIRIGAEADKPRPSTWLVENLSIVSSDMRSSEQGSGNGIEVVDGFGRMNNVTVSGFGNHGIYLRGGSRVGGGNVNNSYLDRVRVYGCGGDGIRLEGSDCQQILIVKPDIVANYGWGINFNSCSANEVIAPHFDQQYNGSPGIIRDFGNSNTVGFVYAEQGQGRGSRVLLDREPSSGRESRYFRCEFSEYGGDLEIVDKTTSQTADVYSRSEGRLGSIAIRARAGHQRMVLEVGDDGAASVLLESPGASGAGRRRMIGFPAKDDAMVVDADLFPPESTMRDLGRDDARWRSVNVSQYVSAGVFDAESIPSASSVPIGSFVFRSDLGKPVWADGSRWVDSNGQSI